MVNEEDLSIRQACIAVKLSLSVYYYRCKEKTDDKLIIDALEKLAERHPTYGFKKMFYLLRAEGYLWNHKRVYVMMGLNIRRKRKRRLPARVKNASYTTH